MPPRSRNPAGPTPVEAITHADKRLNIPTADAVSMFGADLDVQHVSYPRDPSLDPQLVWRGKDEQDSQDLYVDAPPIYQQERIDPRVLIENLRTTAAGGEVEPELTLFESFEGLDELSSLDFYQHAANWSNRMILGDSLQVMASLAEREALRGQVQMIYIDPPYGIKFGSNWQASARKRDVKDGKLEDAAREAEQIKAFRDTWELGVHSYLNYLRDRLVLARDLLTESGSVFVQIGDENVHLVRSLLDEVLGSENFVSQIAMQKSGSTSSLLIPNTLDYLLVYARNKFALKYRPLLETFKLADLDTRNYRWVESRDGSTRPMSLDERQNPLMLTPNDRPFRFVTATSQGVSTDRSSPISWRGVTVSPGADRHWSVDPSIGFRRLELAGRLTLRGATLEIKRYLDDFPVNILKNIWLDTGRSGFGEEQMYVVQTNTKAIQRCILMATDPGDLVLDPTCGSGSTALVAEQWGRRWITIDTSRVALALARQRLMGAKYPYYLLADSSDGRAQESKVIAKVLPPRETTNDIRYGFVYERARRIQPTSIANNSDIVEGMSREAIQDAVKKHADFETLYDRPYEDGSKVRVTGPFTVESLTPHRALAFEPSDVVGHAETISERSAATEPGAATFEQSILDNLVKAGIQNGRRNERIKFDALDPYAGAYLQATGIRAANGHGDVAAVEDEPTRIGIAIGPQYGTVSPAFIKGAAREAIKAGDVDLVAVLGFAFDAQATDVTESDGVTVETSAEGFASVEREHKVGRIKVLLVRMNIDLLMGEELAKTGAGNLFTVFGEPDIALRKTEDGQCVVDLRGVDVYDPTTGAVRSNDTSQIALWMIDTNYNEEAFFVRHCYFTGGNDPYKRLKTALKAEIDADAWASLHRTVSRPFPKPETGKIAVKVINDYGDEVMKVFDA